MRESQNNANSTLMQILNDLKCLYPNKSDQIKDLLDGLSSKDITAVDNKFAAHRYPEKSITYTQVKNYDNNIARQGISVYAAAIISLMERCASQDGYVSLSVAMIQAEIGIRSHNTIRQALTDLINRNIIAVYRPSRQHTPAIYMINPDSSNIGRPPSDADRNDYRELLCTEYCPSIPERQLAKITITSDNGRKITYGTLMQSSRQKNSPEVAATTPGTGDDKIISSIAIENAISDGELPFDSN